MILTTALLAALLSNPFAPKPKPAATAPAPAAAAPAPAPVPDVLPKGFEGYTHPEVTAAMCKVINTARSQCVLPAMTAGRYLIEAIGVSTATPPAAATTTPTTGAATPAKSTAAVQALTIVAGARLCGSVESPPWTSGQRAQRLNCEITVMADAPFPITVIYADLNATKDPRGPGISVRRLPWDGVLTTAPYIPKQ